MAKSLKKKRKGGKSAGNTSKSGKKRRKSEGKKGAKLRESSHEAAEYVANLIELHKLQGVLLRKLASRIS